VVMCNQQTRGAGLSRRLEKARTAWETANVPGLLLLRDARNGIGVNAQVARNRLQALEKDGARLVQVSPEALSALDAITRLLADARSGDLGHRGETVPASQVEQWLAGHFPPAADELLENLTAKNGRPDNLLAELTALTAEAKVIRLEEAATRLGISPEEVEECARRNPAVLGFAGGNTRVLFHVVRLPAPA